MTTASRPAPKGERRVLRLVPRDEDARIVEALREGRPGAAEALFDRYGEFVRRIVARVMGPDGELLDIVHDAFVQAMQSVNKLEDPSALKAWLASIAVHTARGRIRRRRRFRLFFVPFGDEAPDTLQTSPEASEALRATYAMLARLPVDERIVFALRFIEGMELTEVAAACGFSLATAKRRLSSAQELFLRMARECPEVRPWLEGGGRWTK